MKRVHLIVVLSLVIGVVVAAQSRPGNKPRARELGISALIGGTLGSLDAITDVAGVEVGHTTLISGEGALVVGKGPVRTGVTVVHPRGRQSADPVFASWFTLNGNGEMTGTTWIDESGFLEGPIAITNTHSVGVVRDAILKWQVSRPGLQPWGLPVVAETYDGGLNDINGFHVRDEHVLQALDGARSGPVAEGNVGGGTGMICHQFKGGIGTASRVIGTDAGGFTVGVLVQCNYGGRPSFRVAGMPVGREIADLLPCRVGDAQNDRGVTRRCDNPGAGGDTADPEQGSIIVLVATDAPLMPHQLKRLAKRVALGIGRMGGNGGNSSGDIFLAFSTANPKSAAAPDRARVELMANARMNALFDATVQATEESILNALLAAESMTGASGLRVYALPHDRLLTALRKYNALK
ncbi:MAG TPA: P1 family peptidase [Vicinamibacterales bacterium]|nr:P1 family peptidase [Vicinamibacterales bacterium]